MPSFISCRSGQELNEDSKVKKVIKGATVGKYRMLGSFFQQPEPEEDTLMSSTSKHQELFESSCPQNNTDKVVPVIALSKGNRDQTSIDKPTTPPLSADNLSKQLGREVVVSEINKNKSSLEYQEKTAQEIFHTSDIQSQVTAKKQQLEQAGSVTTRKKQYKVAVNTEISASVTQQGPLRSSREPKPSLSSPSTIPNLTIRKRKQKTAEEIKREKYIDWLNDNHPELIAVGFDKVEIDIRDLLPEDIRRTL